MTDATPGMMNLARKCAAKYWQTGDPGDEAAARSILSGAWDDQAYTQAALAAIIETQRLDAAEAERVINKMRGSGESDLRTARHLVCAAIRAGQHYGKDER